MEKWENLKVYHNLPSEEIPIRFKKFAHYILDKLTVNNFKLKESKTLKKFYRFNDEFEQSICFDNSSRWSKNQKDTHIYVCIKPLYTEKEQPYKIFEAFQINPAFKMYYPLTQEFLLLADNLVERVEKFILPFFERFSSSEKIINEHNQLLECYKIPFNNVIPLNFEIKQLIFDCSFRKRDKEIFYKLLSYYLDERKSIYEKLKNDKKFVFSNLQIVERLNLLKQTFDNDELYVKEIESQNSRATEYIASFDKKKNSR